MSAQASLSDPPTTPAGAMADSATPSTLLLLFIIRLLIAWAEGAAASIRQRAETADIGDLLRDFGTTDTALVLQRITHGLQRLRALEAKVLLRHAAGLGSDPLPTSSAAAASARSPSAPQPPSRAPQDLHHLPPARTPGHRTVARVRATGPPSPTQPEPTATGPVHPLTPRGMAGPVVPIPLRH